MDKKEFAVIGLGRFGTTVAKTLYSLGNEVLAIDADEDTVSNIADFVTHAVQADVTDENSLKELGIRNFDVVVIAIGADIQASIMASLLVKDLGAKYIVAKANSELHAKVLYKIGVDRVILPERDMGVRLAHGLVLSNLLEYIELSPGYSIVEFVAPDSWVDKTIEELEIRVKYGINIIAIKSVTGINVSPLANDKISVNDVIAAIGSESQLLKLEKLISSKRIK